MNTTATSPAVFALLLLSLNGCISPPYADTAQWGYYTMEPLRQNPPPKRAGNCRKRGCYNHRLIFNPADKAPSATDLHRGW